jgi:phage terminase large subunit GpA-like protein
MIGVDAAKTAIYDRLKIREPGPGYCHFPMGRELEYFEQLTAEKKFTRYHNGFPKQEWRKPANARNEGLDARVLGYAALHALYASGLRLNVHCDRFAQMAGSQRKDMTDAPPAPPAAAVTKAAQTEPPQSALSERAEEPRKPHPAAGPRYIGRFDVSHWLG